MGGNFVYDPTMFQDAKSKLEGATKDLVSKASDINAARGIADPYDGRDLVDSAAASLPKIAEELMMLWSNMNNTLALMGETGNFSDFQAQLLGNIMGTNNSGNVTMQYYTANGVENYNAVCGIVGGSAQGKDFCLATARIYCQLVCRDKFQTDSYAECNGYNFSSSNNALEYVKKEIESGYPVIIEVDNRGDNKVSRHFAMAFAVSEDGKDVLYLDPVAGEVKKLGESWQEYGLMARNLYDEGTGNYWIGSFSGSTPDEYNISNNGSSSKYQNLPEEYSDPIYHEAPYNPYAEYGYAYQASIYLDNGTTICGNGANLYATSQHVIPTNTDTQVPVNSPLTEEEIPLAPSINGYHGPQNMPWIAPGATHENYQSYQGVNTQNI